MIKDTAMANSAFNNKWHFSTTPSVSIRKMWLKCLFEMFYYTERYKEDIK